MRKDGTRFILSGVMHPLKDGDLRGFVRIARDMTERLAAEKAAHDKILLQKIVGTQEDERRRIARDLHDELGQLLTALRMRLETARGLCNDDNPKLSEEIDELQLLAKRVDDGVDFLAWELRPAALDDLGLYAALGKYINEWKHYSGITAELLNSSIKKKRFARDAETNLYRIAQEALNNAHKYSEAKYVSILFEKRGDLVVLIIEDDGVGFDPDDKMNHLKGIGLLGMRERAALIGGSLEIEAAPERGTTIFVKVPIERLDSGEN